MSTLANFVQLVVTGLGLGAVYALVALGFVMIYRAVNVVNFAQGDFAMIGAYTMVLLAVQWHLPFLVACAAAIVVMAVFGVLFQLGVYYPLRYRSFLPVIISTIGASILLENGVLAIAGPTPQSLPAAFGNGGLHLGSVFVSYQYLTILVVTIVLVALQYLFFEHTLLGKKMQATAQDMTMARLLGIPVGVMIALTFAYSAMLGGVAGVLVGPIIFVSTGMGSSIALQAFAASIIGGFGSIEGAIIGGLLLGVTDSLGAGYLLPAYHDVYGFLLLIAILILRPQGLLGEKIAEKA
jgi:branched-chain amino acid transport system permease protein